MVGRSDFLYLTTLPLSLTTYIIKQSKQLTMKEKNDYYIWQYGGLVAFCVAYYLTVLSSDETVVNNIFIQASIVLNTISIVGFSSALLFHLTAKEKNIPDKDIERIIKDNKKAEHLINKVSGYSLLAEFGCMIFFISPLSFFVGLVMFSLTRESIKKSFSELKNKK